MEIDHIGIAPSGMLESGNSTPVGKSGKKGTLAPTLEPQQEESDEQKLVRALKELDRLHEKLIDLRSAIPKMIQPVNDPAAYTGPEELFKDFMTRTVKATEDVVDFTNAVVENRWVFDRASASRAADPKDIKRWKFSAAQPIYLTAEEKSKANAAANANANGGDAAAAAARRRSEVAAREDVDMVDATESVEEKDPHAIIEDFRKEHGEDEITIEEKDGEIKVSLPKEVGLNFTIKRSSSNEKQRWLVKMPQNSNLLISIFRSITTRPNPQSLKHLLDMMLAYSTIYSQKCDKCENLAGVPNAALPVIRRLIKNVKIERTEKKKDAASEKKEGGIKSEGAKEGGSKAKKKEDDVKKDPGDKKIKQEPKEPSSEVKLDESQDMMDIKKEEDEAPGEDDEFDEKEVVEEKWVAYHETCLQ